ncbi:hypothetical protein B0H14DRAFT_3495818 [Mycena olivaceomarginata]|nr:hypothetical protein B0H14DRAFT_3495818 [Mycena olivaceomarginata]
MHHATRAARQYQKMAKEPASSPNLILTITTPRDPMPTTVRDLILILQIFFPGELSIHKAFYVLGVIISLYPLLRLHLNQRTQPHQPSRTAWTKSILEFLKAALEREDEYPPIWATGLDRGEEFAQHICDELSPLYMMLGLDPHNLAASSTKKTF